MSSPTTPDRTPEPTPDTTGTQTPGTHAVPRPYPPVAGAQAGQTPSPATTPATPATSPLPAAPTAATAGATAPPAPTPAAAARAAVPPSQVPPTAPTAVVPGAPVPASEHATRRADRHERLELPEPPPKPGVLRHALGIVLGVVLTPVALGLAGVGVARLLDLVGTDDPVADPAALVMLGSGAGLLVIVVLLAIWSPAVPITGGLLALAAGLAYLVVPGPVDDVVRALTDGRVQSGPVDQLTSASLSGQLLLAGALVLAGGIAAAVARRKGRRFGQLTTAVEQARVEATRADAARQAARAQGR